MNKEFIKVRSNNDIVISLSLIIVGSILIALPTGLGVNIAGFFFILGGIILAFVLKTAYKETGSGEKFKKKVCFFQPTMKDAILATIESDPSAIDISQEGLGNALKLDLYYSKSAGRAYVQLFGYVPYQYLPCSKMFEHEIGHVTKLI